MVVTEIEDVSRARSLVRLDDGSSFCLYSNELAGLHIVQGESIADEHYRMIVEEILPKRARLRTLNLLARRPYTEYQLRVKLSEGGYPDTIIEDTIKYLNGMHFIDDYAYCRDYAFHNGSVKSRRRIMSDLLKKGVPADIIDSAIKSVIDDGDMALEDSLIYRLLEKRHYDRENASFEDRQKIRRFLYGRGFDRDSIERCT